MVKGPLIHICNLFHSVLFIYMILCVFISRALQGGLNSAGDMNQGVTHQINGTLNHSAMTTCLADILERKLTKDSHGHSRQKISETNKGGSLFDHYLA